MSNDQLDKLITGLNSGNLKSKNNSSTVSNPLSFLSIYLKKSGSILVYKQADKSFLIMFTPKINSNLETDIRYIEIISPELNSLFLELNDL